MDNVREKLELMGNIPGITPILDLLEQGMREPILHSTALEMLLSIDRKGVQIFFILKSGFINPGNSTSSLPPLQ